MVVDRYSGWFNIYYGEGAAKSLIGTLTALCRDFGVPETVTTDGGPQFTSDITETFFKQYGISHRLCSVAHPHANTRAEVAVKTAKRILTGNVTSTGRLDTLSLSKALLLHRNTPDRDIGLSPAEMIFGRPI